MTREEISAARRTHTKLLFRGVLLCWVTQEHADGFIITVVPSAGPVFDEQGRLIQRAVQYGVQENSFEHFAVAVEQ